MKSLMLFLQRIAEELAVQCGTSATLDLKKIKSRVEHEGLSFLTITLPSFGKDFEKSLDLGYVAHDLFPGFARTGGLPRLLSGFLESVFDSRTGQLLPSPSIEAIRAVRQLTLMFGKINIECSDERIDAAIERFVKCEQDLREAEANIQPERVERFNRIGSLLWASVFSRCDREVYADEIVPKHGPGSVAERLSSNEKWRNTEWTERLERVFPSGVHLVPEWRSEYDLADVRILEPGAERPVRVITVPKTLKSPRIIAVEPSCMQYMQQGLLASIWDSLQADRTAWGFVGWASQVPNQHLAWKGSKYGALATLDLSEASDRVSNQHVRGLLRNHPWLLGAVDASRSRKADVPGHGVIRLAKFASMGSALCFPFEAMVFCTIIFTAIEEQLNCRMTKKDIESYLGRVRVYGDDIIVPVEFVQRVMEVLEDFGLRVNSSKSFWTGKFRESCGKEYYDGHDVSIVRIRSLFPSSLTEGSAIVSTVSTRNQLYFAGLWGAASFLDDKLGKFMPMPVVDKESQVLGRHSFLGPDLSGRLCPRTHKPLVRGVVSSVVIPVDDLDGYGALLKCLTMLHSNKSTDSLPAVGVDHLKRSGRPHTVHTKVRLVPSY